MTFDKVILERIAEMLVVDEVRTYNTIGDAIGFIVHVGTVEKSVKIEQIDVKNNIDVVIRALSSAATQARGEYDRRLRAAFVPIVPQDYEAFIDYKIKTTMSAFGLTREQLGLSEEKKLNRFSAVAEEIDRIK